MRSRSSHELFQRAQPIRNAPGRLKRLRKTECDVVLRARELVHRYSLHHAGQLADQRLETFGCFVRLCGCSALDRSDCAVCEFVHAIPEALLVVERFSGSRSRISAPETTAAPFDSRRMASTTRLTIERTENRPTLLAARSPGRDSLRALRAPTQPARLRRPARRLCPRSSSDRVPPPGRAGAR